MASTYSTNLKIELIGTGDQVGDWGNTTNDNFQYALEQAIVGYGSVQFTNDANLTLSLSDSNSSQTARNLFLYVTSTVSLTTTRDLIVPTIEKTYVVHNATTGSQSIRVKTAAGTGITVPTGKKMLLYVNGTNVVEQVDYATTLAIGSLDITTQFNAGNLRLDGNTISSTNSNGDVIIDPNGSGIVQLSVGTTKIGESNSTATVTTNGTGSLVLNTNAGTNSGSITITQGTNGNITLATDGTGDVYVDADTLRVGDSGADATIQSNGNGDLILKTGNSTTGTITLADGANGDLTIALDGTGQAILNAGKAVLNVSQVVVNAGTVSAPVVAPTDDLNTGVYFSAADTVDIATNGTQRAQWDSSGDFKFNSGYGSVATAYGCRAWVNFDGVSNSNLNGTYSQSGTTVTVSATAHGLIVGSVIYANIVSGTGVDGIYTVASVSDANTFTYTAGTSLTTSGGVELRRNTIRASGNVSSVSDLGTGVYAVNFSIAMPNANYCFNGTSGRGVLGGTRIATFSSVAPASASARFFVVDAAGALSDAEYNFVSIFR